MPPAVGVAFEAHEIGRDRLARIRSRLLCDVREILAKCGAPTPHECPLARGGDAAVGEVVSGDDRQLEIVVHHPVVLPRCLQMAQQSAVTGLQELGGVLANRLAAERFFVTHFAVRGELGERGAHDELGHRVRPHRLHEQRRHQHVAPKIGRVGRQARHQLLARAEQLEARDLALEPRRFGGIGEAPELGTKNLLAPERRERRAVRHDLDTELEGLPRSGARSDRHDAALERDARAARVTADREP